MALLAVGPSRSLEVSRLAPDRARPACWGRRTRHWVPSISARTPPLARLEARGAWHVAFFLLGGAAQARGRSCARNSPSTGRRQRDSPVPIRSSRFRWRPGTARLRSACRSCSKTMVSSVALPPRHAVMHEDAGLGAHRGRVGEDGAARPAPVHAEGDDKTVATRRRIEIIPAEHEPPGDRRQHATPIGT